MVAPDSALENAWTLWFETRPGESKAGSIIYQDRLHEVCPIKSIEQFHEYYSYMKNPDSLPVHSTIYIFRKRTRPMWESFPGGGCWTFVLPRASLRLRAAWGNLVDSCIGERLGSDNIAGIVLGSRAREFVISVWLTSARTSSVRFEVVDHLRELWKLAEGDVIQFKDFHTAVQDNSARMNAVSYRVRANPIKERTPQKKKFILPDPVMGSFTFQY